MKLPYLEKNTNTTYHGGEGISSSQLKDILEDPELFYKKYITKEIKKEDIAAFDVGSYFHTAILEPEKLEEEYIVWDGGVRRGNAWENFKSQNQNKVIITSSEYEQANNLINATKRSKTAMSFLKKGFVEVSCYCPLYVIGGEIYAYNINRKLFCLGIDGWIQLKTDKKLDKATVVLAKARCDHIDPETGVISDLKSTSGNAKNEREIKNKISAYYYDMSASYYLDLFSLAYARTMSTFAWIFASKDFANCKTYLASKDMLRIGTRKWSKAIIEYADCLQRGWKFEDDEPQLIGPNFWDLEILKEKGDML